ncbi:radical SAM protein [Parabacteroides sp. PF5-9]|uniref:radical SAM/SPASM domain-containing protein n=1 Tax=Parabacteroides sp. PF5-9 TaxID=1742404 RepID=UPI00247586B7|nr:radical SAM protein [Parabacteroides sp. PF5-9]MDH6357786.1 uncharacterized protein [Parabacteroides sp. PF5-9]
MYTIIAKVTGGCNLRCRYCYMSEESERGRMNEETLYNMLTKVAKENAKEGITDVIWHGGEPLLMGVDFYKKAVEIQKTILNHRFINSVQSNGTLLNESYLDFFEKNNFKVSLSLDGIQMTHDKNRPYKNGGSSFKDTLFWLGELKKRKINEGRVICVLNKVTASQIVQIYEYAKKERISFKFNPQFPAGEALINSDLGLTPEELAEIYIELFDMWFFDDAEYLPQIEPFDEIIENLGLFKNRENQKIIPFGCNWRNNCAYNFIAVSPNGSVYPCGRFIGEKDYLYGNINNEDLFVILKNTARENFINRNKGLDDCSCCEYNKICNAGCPYHSYSRHKDIMIKDPYCYTYKKLFKHIENIVNNEFEEFENE